MGRTYQPTIKLWADARACLEDLLDLLDESAASQKAQRAGFLAEIPARMET